MKTDLQSCITVPILLRYVEESARKSFRLDGRKRSSRAVVLRLGPREFAVSSRIAYPCDEAEADAYD
jgi:hypothetical protein